MVTRENEKKIMEMIRKAGSEEYETDWGEESGKISTSKKKSNVKQGRVSRARGARFELKVRHDLEEKGRIVDKWTNNVDLDEDKLIIAKRKYNPFSKVMTIGTGFPDFISIKHVHDDMFSVIGVEVKINGLNSKIHKLKWALYLKNKIFSAIWIAKAKKDGRKIEVEYVDFEERYGKS